MRHDGVVLTFPKPRIPSTLRGCIGNFGPWFNLNNLANCIFNPQDIYSLIKHYKGISIWILVMILAVKNLKTRHQGSVARADNIWTFCSCIKCRLKSFLPAHYHYWHHFRVHNFVFNANHESCIIHEQD